MKVNTMSPERVGQLARDLMLDMQPGTTQVENKDLPTMSEVTYLGAPETLEDAVQRLLQVEMLLEDLCRAAEIAAITRNLDVLESFKRAADDYLQEKIKIQQPDYGPMKITVITDQADA